MSDYDTTQRRIVNGKKLQYVTGGSRVKTGISGDRQLTRVGHITDAEKHAAASPYILISDSPLAIKKQYDEGIRKATPGYKYRYELEFDNQGRYIDIYGMKWSADCEVMPGDIIKIIDHENDITIGCLAMVKRVRSETNGTVAAIMQTGMAENSKFVFTRGEYEVIKRSVFFPISEDDYLSRDLKRNDIVKEDLE